ncbi:MAG: hypothetical protein JXQ87_04570 [Bacteroidia bacterium]
MKNLLIILCLLASLRLAAQNVNYSIIENDINKINNVTLEFTPVSIEAWTGSTNESWFGYRAKFSYRLGSFGSVSYTYRPQFNVGSSDISGNRPDQFDFSEITLTKGLGNKTVTGKVKVNLKSSSSGKTTTTTYIMADADYFKVSELRFGLLNYNSHLEYKFADESELYTLSVTSSVFSFGIQKGDINRLKIDSDYGRKKNMQSLTYYFDFLYAPRLAVNENNLSDIANLTGSELQYTKSRFGFRYGLQWTRLTNVGFSTGIELGWRPVIRPTENSAWNRFYLGLNWSFPVVSFRTPTPKAFAFN